MVFEREAKIQGNQTSWTFSPWIHGGRKTVFVSGQLIVPCDSTLCGKELALALYLSYNPIFDGL